MGKTIDLRNKSEVDTFLVSLKQSDGPGIIQIARSWIDNKVLAGASPDLPVRQALSEIRKLARAGAVRGIAGLAVTPIVHTLDVDSDD